MEKENVPLVSVIVGVKNGARTLEALCASVRSQSYPNVELIIVDNDSTDDTTSIARRHTTMVYTAGPERSAQRNWGIGNSHGEYILVLDADMVLAPKLVEEAVNMFLKDPDLACLFVPEETRASGFWGKTKSFERDFYLVGDMSVEAVRFFRRRYLDKVGLFDEMQTGSEDWDLSDRFIFLHKYKYARTTERIVHDEGELRFGDLLKKKRYYIHSGIGEYLKHSPNPLRRLPFPLRPSVRAQWPRFIRHPFLAGMVLMMKTLEAMPLIWMRITKRRNLNASY